MPPLPRVLVTGAAGFLGQALVSVLRHAGFAVRSLDVTALPYSLRGACEELVGDIADPSLATRACEGVDSLVLAHMAPNRPEVYASPNLPFDVNVKGTALLLDAASKARLRRAVLVSSIAVVEGHLGGAARITLDLPPAPTSPYGFTKQLQEDILSYYHRRGGLLTAILRPAYVTDEDNLTDKYGRRMPSVNWQFIDRRDVAGAV
ncbi:MAG TPA: NAD(P)-dependent oxidoreductase, partial [Candidatus Methylacidiphilales bacterium]